MDGHTSFLTRCRAAVLVGLVLVGTASQTREAFAASGSWNVTTSGSWNTAGNWTPNTAVPGTAAGDVVGLVNAITAARTVWINTNVTLGTLNIGASNSNVFTLSGTTGGSLTLNNNGSGASIVQTATSGANLISAGFTLADNLTVTNNQVKDGVSLISALTLAGNITESGGARTLTKTGVGTVLLSGSNTYSGKTTASAGVLQFVNPVSLYGGTTANWTAANVTASSGATLAMSVGSSNFTTGNVTTLLTNLGALGGSVASGQGLQAGSSIGFDTSNAGSSFTVADAIKNSTGAGGGALGLVKLGSGTLSLSGLSSTAANNYTGTTLIDQGGLVLPASQTTRFTGGLTFGISVGSTNTGTLDLTNGSAEFGGTTLVRSQTGTNTILIGAGQSLTSTGNVQIGDATGLTASSGQQTLAVQGSGTWNVTVNNGTFRVGNAGGSRPASGTLDASQLAALNIDLRATASTGGLFTLNEAQTGGTGNIARLATATTIKSATVSMTSGNGNGTNQLLLGSGAQVINANVVTIAGGNRTNAVVQFQGVDGTLTLRDAAGTGRTSSMSVGSWANALSTGTSSTFDVTGHAADLSITTLAIGDVSGGANASVSASLLFDSGTIDATTVNVGRRLSSGSVAMIGSATFNVGSANNLTNTFSIGTLSIAQQYSTTGTINAVTNIAGTTTTGTITSVTIATSTASGGLASGTMNISGGSTRATNGITLVNRSGSPGTANGTLSITGGSLSVGGNIATAGSGGTITSTVTLDGGSLNMNGFALGASGQLIDSLNLRSGTLSNVGQINNGAGLVKTTSGTLTLTGTSTYTGTTSVQAGVVRFNSVAASTGAQSLGSGSVVNLGVAATSTGELDYFGAGGMLDKNVFALGIGRNRIRNSGGGTLTLSGTLTKDGTILELAGGTFDVTGRITGATAGTSDFYVNGATVTLSNANNDYNGPTYVYNAGALVLGTNGVIPDLSVLTLGGTGGDPGTGTLNLGSFSDSVAGVTLVSGSIIGSGTLTAPNYTLAGGVVTGNLGTGTVTVTGNATLAGRSAAGTVNVTAGELTLGAGGTAGSFTNSPLIAVSSGATLAFDRSDNYGGAFPSLISGSGNVRVDSGFLEMTGLNTYTGTTSVLAGGTLAVNGSLANAVLDVASGATLMGTGTIAGLATIAGLHAPGNPLGIQTLDDITYAAGAGVQWQLGGNTDSNPLAFDQVVVGGDLTFGGSTALNLVFNGVGSTVVWANGFWDSSHEWLLYDVAGATSGFGNFTLNTINWQDSTGALFQTVRGDSALSVEQRGSDVYIVYAAVPEPGTLALAGIGLGVAALSLRTCRRSRGTGKRQR